MKQTVSFQAINTRPIMATILEFRRKVSPRSHVLDGAPAEIVLFPGIRYERWEDTPNPKMRKRAKRRDRLEIKD